MQQRPVRAERAAPVRVNVIADGFFHALRPPTTKTTSKVVQLDLAEFKIDLPLILGHVREFHREFADGQHVVFVRIEILLAKV